MTTAHDRLLAVCYNLPLLTADAIVVYCGEDCLPRLQVARQLFASGGGQKIVLLGGLDAPPRVMGAERAVPALMGMGVAFDKLYVETASQHTRDQAVALAKACVEEQWSRVLLVASAYHLPRALLTTIQALAEADLLGTVQVIPVAASHAPWFGAPEGADVDRLTLYGRERAKLETYRGLGHCASDENALAYLQSWEGR